MHEKIILKRDSNGLNCGLKNLSRNQICSFYKHEDELKESIIPFIFKSLELNRKVIFVAKGHMNETVLSSCSKLNNKINTYIQNSQFSLITINASDLKDDKFFPQGIINLIMRECKDAETLEFSEVLIIQDIPYTYEHISVIDQLIEYESVLNQRLQNFKYNLSDVKHDCRWRQSRLPVFFLGSIKHYFLCSLIN